MKGKNVKAVGKEPGGVLAQRSAFFPKHTSEKTDILEI